MHQISQINALQQPQTAVSAMPEVQSEMDASDLLKMILQLRGQGNTTPTKKSSDSNNQAQMEILMNQISQMNALQQPQTAVSAMHEAQSGMDASNLLKMIIQLRGQGNPTPKKKSSASNNQAQMLINVISQMNALQQ